MDFTPSMNRASAHEFTEKTNDPVQDLVVDLQQICEKLNLQRKEIKP